MSLNSDIESIVRSLGLELYDTAVVSEHDETIFRISVISPEFEDAKRKSVNLEKYVELTHLISPLLDVTPPVSSEYRLEVGSPGIERKLTTLAQFKKSIGENVSLLLDEKDKIRAKLLKVEGNTLFLENSDGIKEIDFHDIKKAKTYFEW
ncbi:ribosome maturation factor [Sulfurimonas sp.]|uniref:ribosome maturation factor n=1 Tax=Sulfurimonas sp. TaxID=2022749 RepID=UPI002604ACEA|nr:ribosome maturation factor [Sulfurimonas sp.]